VNNGGDTGTGYFEINIMKDTVKLTNIRARFGHSRYLVGEVMNR